MYFNKEMNSHSVLIKHLEHYNAYEAIYRELPIAMAYELAQQESKKLEVYTFLLAAADFSEDELFQLQFKEFESKHPQLIEQFPNSRYAEDEQLLRLHFQFIDIIIRQLEAMLAYPDYVNQIGVRADHMLSYSIFNEEGSFSYRNILKTPGDFEKVRELPLELGIDIGIASSTTYRMTDLFVIITIFMISMIIFSSEKEYGKFVLLRTTKHGNLSLYGVKIATLISATIFIAVLFYGSILLLANILYGFGDLSRFIQSMEAFKYSHLPLTVIQYLALFIAGKIIICMLLAVLISFMFLIFNHPSKSYLVLSIVLTVSYMSYHFIHPASYLNIFKYVNIIAMLDTHHLLSQYVNLNIANFPVSREIIVVVAMLSLFIIFSMCGAYAFAASNILAGGGGWKWLELKRKRININGFRCLSFHEMFKLIWSAKGWIILTCALVISFYDIQSADSHFDWDHIYYNEYISQLSGELTKKKIQFVEQEKMRFDELPAQSQKLYHDYEQGVLTLEQYNWQKGELEKQQVRHKAFQNVYTQFTYLIELQQKKGIEGYFVNELSTQYLFSNHNRDVMNAILYFLLFILMLSSSFTIDHRHKIVQLLKTTTHGRLRLFASKIFIACLAAFLVLAMIYIPQYVNVIRYYPAMPWDAPIQSIEQYEMIKGKITIFQFVILESVLQLIGSFVAVTFMLLLSQCFKKLILTMLVSIVLFIAPLLAHLFGFSQISNYSLHYPQLLFIMLAERGQQMYTVYYFIGLILLSVCCLFGAWRLHHEGTLLKQKTTAQLISEEARVL